MIGYFKVYTLNSTIQQLNNATPLTTLIVIPARYASTRFPRKPLALLGGKPIIQWVWERVSAMPVEAVVATDDSRILDAVHSFGGKAVMTRSDHHSGTDRCGEVLLALEAQGKHFDIVVNVQGDEPFVKQEQLELLIDSFSNPDVQIATLKKHINSNEELCSPNNVKVVAGIDDRALYFSRQPLPFVRGTEPNEWLQKQDYYKHIGIYAFRSEVLKKLIQLSQSQLEKSESLEQLRWLENGFSIYVKETVFENIGIDTPADLAIAEKALTLNSTNLP